MLLSSPFPTPNASLRRRPRFARRSPYSLTTAALGLSITLTLTACTDTPLSETPPSPDANMDGSNSSQPAIVLPADARAAGDKKAPPQQCPYLDNDWVADTNGQRNINWAIDERFTPPACLWWSYQDNPHVTVLVRTAESEQDAVDMIDSALTHPGTTMDTTISPGDPAATVEAVAEPAGWSGYRASKEESSVYAVRRGLTVVTVHSNQGQTIKPQTIALKVIDNLQL